MDYSNDMSEYLPEATQDSFQIPYDAHPHSQLLADPSFALLNDDLSFQIPHISAPAHSPAQHTQQDDLSDASIELPRHAADRTELSFQIPGAHGPGARTFLLDDDDSFFKHAANDTTGTPVHAPRPRQSSLTLEHLTPHKPRARATAPESDREQSDEEQDTKPATPPRTLRRSPRKHKVLAPSPKQNTQPSPTKRRAAPAIFQPATPPPASPARDASPSPPPRRNARTPSPFKPRTRTPSPAKPADPVPLPARTPRTTRRGAATPRNIPGDLFAAAEPASPSIAQLRADVWSLFNDSVRIEEDDEPAVTIAVVAHADEEITPSHTSSDAPTGLAGRLLAYGASMAASTSKQVSTSPPGSPVARPTYAPPALPEEPAPDPVVPQEQEQIAATPPAPSPSAMTVSELPLVRPAKQSLRLSDLIPMQQRATPPPHEDAQHVHVDGERRGNAEPQHLDEEQQEEAVEERPPINEADEPAPPPVVSEAAPAPSTEQRADGVRGAHDKPPRKAPSTQTKPLALPPKPPAERRRRAGTVTAAKAPVLAKAAAATTVQRDEDVNMNAERVIQAVMEHALPDNPGPSMTKPTPTPAPPASKPTTGGRKRAGTVTAAKAPGPVVKPVTATTATTARKATLAPKPVGTTAVKEAVTVSRATTTARNTKTATEKVITTKRSMKAAAHTDVESHTRVKENVPELLGEPMRTSEGDDEARGASGKQSAGLECDPVQNGVELPSDPVEHIVEPSSDPAEHAVESPSPEASPTVLDVMAVDEVLPTEVAMDTPYTGDDQAEAPIFSDPEAGSSGHTKTADVDVSGPAQVPEAPPVTVADAAAEDAEHVLATEHLEPSGSHVKQDAAPPVLVATHDAVPASKPGPRAQEKKPVRATRPVLAAHTVVARTKSAPAVSARPKTKEAVSKPTTDAKKASTKEKARPIASLNASSSGAASDATEIEVQAVRIRDSEFGLVPSEQVTVKPAPPHDSKAASGQAKTAADAPTRKAVATKERTTASTSRSLRNAVASTAAKATAASAAKTAVVTSNRPTVSKPPFVRERTASQQETEKKALVKAKVTAPLREKPAVPKESKERSRSKSAEEAKPDGKGKQRAHSPMKEAVKRPRAQDERQELPNAKKTKAPPPAKAVFSKPAVPGRKPVVKAATSTKPQSAAPPARMLEEVAVSGSSLAPGAPDAMPTPVLDDVGMVEVEHPKATITRLPDMDEEDRLAASLGEAIASSLMDDEDADITAHQEGVLPPRKPVTDATATASQTPSAHLTISQLSPIKEDILCDIPSRQSSRPPSPMRTSVKRSRSPEPAPPVPRVREDTQNKRARTKASPPPPRARPKDWGHRRDLSKTGTSSSRQKAKATPAVPSSVSSVDAAGPSTSSTARQFATSHSRTTSASALAISSASQPTLPQDFRFQLDSRMEARKQEFQQKMSASASSSNSLSTSQRPIPDFRALHAAEEALRASRMEEARSHLTVPEEFHLSLSERVKERERYERERREREVQRAAEEAEARRREEEETERELREARKRAIPKANEVPEWYQERPHLKKSEQTEQVEE